MIVASGVHVSEATRSTCHFCGDIVTRRIRMGTWMWKHSRNRACIGRLQPSGVGWRPGNPVIRTPAFTS